MQWKCVVSMVLAAVISLPAWAGRPSYRIEPVPNGSGLRPRTAVISPTGEVAGSAILPGGSGMGYRLVDGRPVGLPDSQSADVRGINRGGSIVAMTYPLSSVWHADGAREELGDWWAAGINALGQVSGSVSTPDGGFEAAIYDHGNVVLLGRLGRPMGRAEGINDAGEACGTLIGDRETPHRAFVWCQGVMSDLGTFGGELSFGQAINALGHVAGMAEDSRGRQRPFVHDGAQMREIPGLDREVTFFRVTGLNRHGEVLGLSTAGPLLHARNGRT